MGPEQGDEGTMEKAAPHDQKPRRLTGSRLGTRGVLAQAMLEQGASVRTVRKVTGVSTTTASFLRRNKVIPRAQVEAVKKHLQDRFALIASEALEAIDADKLKAAGFGELVRGAAVAANQAGITAPSVAEIYSLSIAKYLVVPPPHFSEDPQPRPDTPPDPLKPALPPYLPS